MLLWRTAWKKERMQTELITNVSHDLKTPLTSIINYVDLMKRENLWYIRKYRNIFASWMRNPRDWRCSQRMWVGGIQGKHRKHQTGDEWYWFCGMVQQVIGEFEEKFQEKNLTMMVHFTDEPSIIYADGQRMWRVLENVFGKCCEVRAMEGTRVYAEISNRNKVATFPWKIFQHSLWISLANWQNGLSEEMWREIQKEADWDSLSQRAWQSCREVSCYTWMGICLRWWSHLRQRIEVSDIR